MADANKNSSNNSNGSRSSGSDIVHNYDDLEEQVRKLYRGLALAPMVRASTTPLRTLALQYGANFVYTEELVDRSITSTTRVVNTTLNTIDYVKDTSTLSKKVQKRLHQENDRPALLLRIAPHVEQGKLICQLGSGEPELALAAATHVHQDVAAIDINMGCPKKFSVSGGMGSALLSDPDRASRIVKTLRSELSSKPVSVKIRLLNDTASTLHFIETMIQAGAQALAIHARRVGDEPTTPADWDTLKVILGLLRPKYPTFPFLLNGDFYTQAEIDTLLNETQAQGILLARPALYNTSMFRVQQSEESGQGGGGQPPPSSSSSCSGLLDKTVVIQDYLQHAIRYEAHYKNVKYVICEMMNNRRAPTPRVPYLPHVYPGGQTIAKTCNSHSMPELCTVWNVNYSDYCPRNGKNNQNNNNNSHNNNIHHPVELTPGEHKYEDSYFLKDDHTTTTTAATTTTTTTTTFTDPPSQNNAMNGTGSVVADHDDDNDNDTDKHEPQAKRPCLNGNSITTSTTTSSNHRTTETNESRDTGTMDKVD